AEHLRFGNVANLLHDFEDWRRRPRAEPDLNPCSLRQNARNVFRQTAAGDMRQSFYHSAIEQAFKRAQITQVRTQQRFADGGVELAQISIRRAFGDLKEKFARQRVSVCMQTDRGQGEHDVVRRDRTSIDYLFAIDYADDEAR